MNDQQEPATWREFLGQIIAKPQERARLAAAMRVKPITLQRWASGVFKPRDEHLHTLLKNLPAGAYPLFMRLLVADFPEMRQEEVSRESFSEKIPSEFYARALSNLALAPSVMYRQSMQDLLLQQILQHLDPDRQGLSVTLVVCVPPRPGHKVRSLREIGGLATPPWPHTLAEKPMFLGAESLVGYAIGNARPFVINSREEMTFFPAHWTEHEQSAAAFPILQQARIAGGLIISSAQEYFFTAPCLEIIEDYTALASTLFEAEETFAPTEIELRPMPAYKLQSPYFTGYNRRVLHKLAEASETGQQMPLAQARQLVWQDLEDVLLQVFLRTEAGNKGQSLE